MSIDLTTVASSGLVAAVIGVIQLVANRYTNRILDRIEKSLAKKATEEDNATKK